MTSAKALTAGTKAATEPIAISNAPSESKEEGGLFSELLALLQKSRTLKPSADLNIPVQTASSEADASKDSKKAALPKTGKTLRTLLQIKAPRDTDDSAFKHNPVPEILTKLDESERFDAKKEEKEPLRQLTKSASTLSIFDTLFSTLQPTSIDADKESSQLYLQIIEASRKLKDTAAAEALLNRLKNADSLESLKQIAEEAGLHLKKITVETDAKASQKPLAPTPQKEDGPIDVFKKSQKEKNDHKPSLSTVTAALLQKAKPSLSKSEPIASADLKAQAQKRPLQKNESVQTALKPSKTAAATKSDENGKSVPSLQSLLANHPPKSDTKEEKSAPVVQKRTPTKTKRPTVDTSLFAETTQTQQRRENEPERIDTPQIGIEDLPIAEGVSKETKSAEELRGKIAEAKQTVRHFAQSLKEQVEQYKPPFTRMQLSLEPKELGSVEVTLISRGNNLHVQVTSNPTAIGVMATQGQELKSQLVNMGFTDVQMQFSMNQQSRRDHHSPASAASRYTENEEAAEYDLLEIIIPQYV